MAENLIYNVLLDKELLEKKVNFLEGMLNEDDKRSMMLIVKQFASIVIILS